MALPLRPAVLILLAAVLGLPALADQAGDEQLLRTAQVGTDGPSLLAYFRQRTVTSADKHRIEELIRRLGDPAYAVRERAMTDLIACGLPAIGPLRRAQSDPDVEIARRADRCLERIERVPSAGLSAAAARSIARLKPAGAAGVLLAYLPVADDEPVADEVRTAIAAVALADGKPDPALARGLEDASPIVRGAAAEALAKSGSPAAVETARKALSDGNADVRLRTALALVTKARDKSAVPAMIGLLGDLDQGSGWRIEDALIRLAGDARPKVTLGEDAAARQRCRDAWLAWWDKNGGGIDLAKLDGVPPMLGHTLLVLRDQRTLNGKVVEINAKKEPVWKIEGLQSPSDAVVVGPDRVLIAEENAHQVTERDLTGKVIWSKQVIQPIGVQRLSNGNTFVVCRNQLLEFDVRHNQVFSYQRQAQFDICAAQRLRNGETAFLTRAGQVVRLDSKGKESKPPIAIPRALYMVGGFEVLPNDHLLVSQRTGVAEYDAAGRSPPVWQATFQSPTSVQRLPNGNTLVCTGLLPTPMAAELDHDGHVVWEYKSTDGFVPWRARRR